MQASAPGKVLILGGYLIVQAPNIGISIGVNARFTTRVLSSAASSNSYTVVRVASPQFHSSFTFECYADAAGVTVKQADGPASPFLKYGILYATAASRLWSHNDQGQQHYVIELELLADNDFYSQRNYLEAHSQTVCVAALRSLPPHLPLVGGVSKTGLGSSAAMTTSVVACLLTCLRAGYEKPDTEALHRVAQVAHSVAQGKIGSGFDVYTAVYGTCAYRRFPASAVECMMRGEDGPERAELAALAECIDPSKVWVAHEPFRLPAGLKLVLGDVHQGGSSTPGMVAKIMAWQKSLSTRDDNLWDRLRQSNEAYVSCLRALLTQAADNAEAHAASVQALSSVCLMADSADEQRAARADAAQQTWLAASKCAARSRAYLREMGEAAGVEVEPVKLTALLDATAALPGVFAVGCPGAGGYDAVFALVLTEERCRTVEEFWESYTDMSVCPLLVREDACGLVIDEC